MEGEENIDFKKLDGEIYGRVFPVDEQSAVIIYKIYIPSSNIPNKTLYLVSHKYNGKEVVWYVEGDMIRALRYASLKWNDMGDKVYAMVNPFYKVLKQILKQENPPLI